MFGSQFTNTAGTSLEEPMADALRPCLVPRPGRRLPQVSCLEV